MILEEADLELALTPPTDGSNIKATVVRLTPEDAHNILRLRNFQRHRRIVQRRPVNGVMVHRCISTWVTWWYVGVQRLCR